VKIVVDAQLPPGLASLLIDAGHHALHVSDLGLRHSPDAAVWNHALREAAVIFTKDEDFALRRLRATTGPTIVWLRIGNCSKSALERWLMPLLPEIEQMATAGEVLIEVR
jgi:predicted nuclease of predicted toxin-antitoxin system